MSNEVHRTFDGSVLEYTDEDGELTIPLKALKAMVNELEAADVDEIPVHDDLDLQGEQSITGIDELESQSHTTEEANRVQYVKTPATNTDVEAAIADLPSGGGVVEIEGGEVVGTVRIEKENVILRGQGYATTIRIGDEVEQEGDDACVRVLAEHCVVENLRCWGNPDNQTAIDGFSEANSADGVAIYASNCKVRNLWVEDILGHGIAIWSANHSEDVPEGARNNVHIINNRIHNGKWRAQIDLADTQASEKKYPHNHLVIGNVITAGPQSMDGAHGISGHAQEGTVIIGNGVYGGGRGIDFVEGSRYYIIANNALLNLDDDGIRVNNMNDSVVMGNTIHDCVGRGIDIREECSNMLVANNVIEDVGVGDSRSGIVAWTIDATEYDPHENIRIRGNTIDGATSDGVRIVDCDGVTVADNWITDVSGAGVRFEDTVTGLAAIKGNDIYNYSGTRSAIQVESTASIKNNDINNVISGMNIQAPNCHITGNDIRGTEFSGIQDSENNGHFVAIRTNFLTDIGGTAIEESQFSTDSDIEQNTTI